MNKLYYIPILIALIICQQSFARTPIPIFAISQATIFGPDGNVRLIYVGVIPSGDSNDCEKNLKTYSGARDKHEEIKYVKGIKDGCVTELPKKLKGITEKRSIQNAYTVEVLSVIDGLHLAAPLYMVWYDMDESSPQDVCKKLISFYQRGFEAKNLKVLLDCIPPARQ